MPPEAARDSAAEIQSLQLLFETEPEEPEKLTGPERLIFHDLKRKTLFRPKKAYISGVHKYMRVQLKLSEFELHFKTEGRVILYELNKKDSIVVTKIRDEFSVKRNGNELEIFHPIGTYWGSVSGNLVLKSMSDKNIIILDDLGYRGNLEIRLADEGKMSVINRVNLEDYVRDVLPYEMPVGNPAIIEWGGQVEYQYSSSNPNSQ